MDSNTPATLVVKQDQTRISIVGAVALFVGSVLSYFVGVLARLELGAVSKYVNRLFVFVFGIDMQEAEKPIEHYKSVEDVFTRRLKQGERPLGEGDVLSPADGTLSWSAPIYLGTAIQAKGIVYSAEELVFGSGKVPKGFLPSWYTTVYLAPHNYHRVHTPVDGTLSCIRYIPGAVWPVNKPAVSWVPSLFTRNERLVFTFDSKQGRYHLVMVAALNVARMVTPFWEDLVTHARIKVDSRVELPYLEKSFTDVAVNKGSELGTFMLGSTVVLIFEGASIGETNLDVSKGFDSKSTEWGLERIHVSKTVRMGENL